MASWEVTRPRSRRDGMLLTVRLALKANSSFSFLRSTTTAAAHNLAMAAVEVSIRRVQPALLPVLLREELEVERCCVKSGRAMRALKIGLKLPCRMTKLIRGAEVRGHGLTAAEATTSTEMTTKGTTTATAAMAMCMD